MKEQLLDFLSRPVYASSKKKIVVLAGHDDDTWENTGGKGIKTSLTSDGEYEEYDSNIEIVKDTVRLLRKHDEFIVYFPQENGRDMSLRERVDYCNSVGADIVISVHSNASGSKSAHGACAFHYPSSGGRKLAREYRDVMKSMGYPLWSDGTYECQEGTWSWFYVVTRTKAPTVLTENFFFTNPKELKKYLLDPEQLDNLSYAHYVMACEYFGISPKDPDHKNKKEEDIKQMDYKKDAQPSASLKGEVEKAKALGISDGSYPHRPTKREEVMSMTLRGFELSQKFSRYQGMEESFAEHKQYLPLNDPEGWEDLIKNQSLSQSDISYFNFMVTLRLSKEVAELKKKLEDK